MLFRSTVNTLMKSPIAFELSFLNFSGEYVLGQTAKHAWQSSGHSPFIIGFVSSIFIRLSGQTYSQAPQSTHAPISTTFDFKSRKLASEISLLIESSDLFLWYRTGLARNSLLSIVSRFLFILPCAMPFSNLNCDSVSSLASMNSC